jgi:hypothetical protein
MPPSSCTQPDLVVPGSMLNNLILKFLRFEFTFQGLGQF